MILSTQDFKKPLLAIAVGAVIGVLFVGCYAVLNRVSVWAERDLGAFPFKQEDWLRYLLRSKFDRPKGRKILLTGPSTVRENFLYDEFVAAFPGHVIEQGGISLGTMEDVNLSLEYMERVYGRGSLPGIIVLGVAPRFIANIPDDRPFKKGINDYSPYLKAVRNANRYELKSKGVLESLLARSKFLFYKKPSQFQTDMLAVTKYWLTGQTIYESGKNFGVEQGALIARCDRFFGQASVQRFISGTRYDDLVDFQFSAVLADKISPYKYRLSSPVQPETLIKRANYKSSWWGKVHSWNPKEHQSEILPSLRRFMNFVDRHNIRLLVVNMPERDINRAMFNAEYYEEYLGLLENTFGKERLVDLREFLPANDFFDLEHSVYSGSLKLSREVIGHLRTLLSANAS